MESLFDEAREAAERHGLMARGSAVVAAAAGDGGVQEILTLLDRTRAGLRSGVVTVEQVRRALAQARRGFAVNADHLGRMVTSAPLEDLLAERRHHRAGDALLTEAKDLISMVV